MNRVLSSAPKGIQVHTSHASQQQIILQIPKEWVRLPQHSKNTNIAFERSQKVIAIPSLNVVPLFWFFSSTGLFYPRRILWILFVLTQLVLQRPNVELYSGTQSIALSALHLVTRLVAVYTPI